MLLCMEEGNFLSYLELFDWCLMNGVVGRILNVVTYVTGKTHLNLLAEYILPDLVSLHCQLPFFCGVPLNVRKNSTIFSLLNGFFVFPESSTRSRIEGNMHL